MPTSATTAFPSLLQRKAMATTTTAAAPSRSTRSLLALPISAHAPIYHLPPDPLFPTPASLLHLAEYDAPPEFGQDGPVALKEGDPVPPSMLRRSRQIRRGGCFTYVSPCERGSLSFPPPLTPLKNAVHNSDCGGAWLLTFQLVAVPIEFPYDIREDKDEERTNSAKPSTIETHLAEYEVSVKHPVQDAAATAAAAGTESGPRPTAYSSAVRESERYPRARLLSLNKQFAADWLPQLDLGADAPGDAARQQLVDVLAGRTVLAREPDATAQDVVGKNGFAPWSLCYGSCPCSLLAKEETVAVVLTRSTRSGSPIRLFRGAARRRSSDFYQYVSPYSSWTHREIHSTKHCHAVSTPVAEEVGAKTGYRAIELQLKGLWTPSCCCLPRKSERRKS